MMGETPGAHAVPDAAASAPEIVVNGLDFTDLETFSADYVARLRRTGIHLVVITAADAETADDAAAVEGCRRWHQRFNGIAGAAIVGTVAAARQARADGQVGVVLGFQNAKPMESDLDAVARFARLGVRVVQLTYNLGNAFGSGALDPADRGLTSRGRALIAALNDAGILLDVSHAAPRTAREAIAASRMPAAATHVAAAALCPHFRAIDDDLIRAIADGGGCVGIAALSVFLRRDARAGGATIDDYLDHVDHVVRIAGVDHVGLGFDIGAGVDEAAIAAANRRHPEFGFPTFDRHYVAALRDAGAIAALATGLRARGYGDADVSKVLGENWMRVFQDAWTPSAPATRPSR